MPGERVEGEIIHVKLSRLEAELAGTRLLTEGLVAAGKGQTVKAQAYGRVGSTLRAAAAAPVDANVK